MRRFSLLSILLAFVVLSNTHIAGAQDNRSAEWLRWDVTIDQVDFANNRYHVSETHEVSFSGTFRFGSRVIVLNNLEDIQDIRVYDGGQRLHPDCADNPGTICVTDTSEGRSIRYFFTSPVTNASRTIRIEYTVVGALRVYPGGDQLWWAAIPDLHRFPIRNSIVTVALPSDAAPREGIDPIVTYGAPAQIQVYGSTIRALATRQIAPDEEFSLRVQYPHQSNARMAVWQPTFDAQRAFAENTLPVLNVAALGLALLVAVGGPLILFARWYTKGRDPEAGPVPQYLTDPPSPLPPAVVGTLLDETANTRDVLSTLIDLARRGYVYIRQGADTFYFSRSDRSVKQDLHGFEERFLKRFFATDMQQSTETLRGSFYRTLPLLKEDLYEVLVKNELVTSNPHHSRRRWTVLAVIVLVMSLALLLTATQWAGLFVTAIQFITIGFAVYGAAMFGFAAVMPAKTRRGAQQAAKWKAFREYLRRLQKNGEVREAVARFDEFLPYAIAFGMEKEWIRLFSRERDVPAPRWYIPYDDDQSRYTTDNSPVSITLGERLAPSSLDSLATRLTHSLEAISEGLTDMFNAAASAMTSQPGNASSDGSGSWDSGGSSWSGGGSDGGSSGGGSADFG